MRRRAQPVPSRPPPRAPPRRAELVSWKPRAILLHGFLTHAECDHVIAVATPELQRSSVVAAEGGSKVDSIRTRQASECLCGQGRRRLRRCGVMRPCPLPCLTSVPPILHLPAARSYGMFIKKGHDDVIARIDDRVARATHLPVAHQEDLQVLRCAALCRAALRCAGCAAPAVVLLCCD